MLFPVAERWLSGRRRRSRKPLTGQPVRGFESPSLRHPFLFLLLSIHFNWNWLDKSCMSNRMSQISLLRKWFTCKMTFRFFLRSWRFRNKMGYCYYFWNRFSKTGCKRYLSRARRMDTLSFQWISDNISTYFIHIINGRAKSHFLTQENIQPQKARKYFNR